MEETHKALPEIEVFPNPAKYNITIAHNGTRNMQFVLYDLTGKLILQKEINRGTNEATVNVATVGNGLYIYKFLDGDWIVGSGKIAILR